MNEIITLERKGGKLILTFNGRRRYITLDIDNPSKTARSLEKELKELEADKNIISYAKTLLAKIYDEIASEEPEKELGEVTNIVPVFDESMKKIHPAIDLVDGIAYVGVTIPCRTEDEEGNEIEKEFPFLITSTREQILCVGEELRRRRLRLAYKVLTFDNRWSLKSIRDFLTGKASVDPAEVYNKVKGIWKTYIEFDEEIVYDFITLWTIGTYFHHLFNAYPYIYIGGLKGSGKTKVLTVASLLCFNAIFSNNISTSSIFRLIQSGRCTLLLDETEKLVSKDRAEELRNLLLSGYKKGAKVYRTETLTKDRLIPMAFEVYSPKMIANVAGIEDVLEDRCITIIMRKGRNKEILNREPNTSDPIWQELRDKLYLLYLLYHSEVCELNAVCERTRGKALNKISERDLELWWPILILAKFFSKYLNRDLHSPLLSFAEEKVREKRTENVTETGEYILVKALLNIVEENGYYKVKEIKEAMMNYFDEEQRWLNTQWIGRALKRLGFKEKRRVGTGYEYLLKRQAVEDIALRLGIIEDDNQDNMGKNKHGAFNPVGSQTSVSSLSSPSFDPSFMVFHSFLLPSLSSQTSLKNSDRKERNKRLGLPIKDLFELIQCPYCDMKFVDSKTMNYHISSIHGGEPNAL